MKFKPLQIATATAGFRVIASLQLLLRLHTCRDARPAFSALSAAVAPASKEIYEFLSTLSV